MNAASGSDGVSTRIREAHEADAGVLSGLARRTYVDAFASSMRAGDLAAHLDRQLSAERVLAMLREDVFLLAFEAEALAGFAQLGDARVDAAHLDAAVAPRPGDQEIRRLYVLAERQGRGIGTRLLEAALAHRRVAPDADVYLDVWRRNAAARRLYERHGFERAGERPFDVASGEATGVDVILVRRAPSRRARPVERS